MMKRIGFLIAGVIFAAGLYAQSNLGQQITEAIRHGNAGFICKQFDSKVELGVLQQKNYYSKEQAERILKKFFNENPPGEFTIQHQGGKDKNLFYIGIYKSRSSSYRIYFHLREKEGKTIIPLFKIESNK